MQLHTKTEAMRWLAAVQTDMARGVFLEPSVGQVSFKAWAEEWLTTKPGQRAATLARDRAAIRTHRRVVLEMQASGLPPKSVGTYVGTLQAMFVSAVEADVIVRSPVRVRRLVYRLSSGASDRRSPLRSSRLWRTLSQTGSARSCC